MNEAPAYGLWTVEQLEKSLDAPDLAIVDVCDDTRYAAAHIPGARHVSYRNIVRPHTPVVADLPDDHALQEIFSASGLTPDMRVVAYDDEGGGKACRLLWTLHVAGHRGDLALLDGGIRAWNAAGKPTTQNPPQAAPTRYAVSRCNAALATKDYIASRLNARELVLVDARSPAEFTGSVRRAKHAGHIPTAINVEWTRAMGEEPLRHLLPLQEIRALYEGAGVTPDKEIIVYCHSNHRSAFSYVVLRLAGYPNVRAYCGSWSEWGNSDNVPIEA